MVKKTHDTTIFTLSHSSMSVIEKCPREWYYKYIQRYYFNNPQPWSDFGLLWHEVSELYRGEGTKRLKEIAHEVMENKGYNIHHDYRPKMKIACENLKNYYDAYLKKAQKIKFEQVFHTDLNEYVDLIGFIDIIYINEDGDLVVVDLKTSKTKSDHTKQLALYYFLLCLTTGKKPKKLISQIVYLSLDTNSVDMSDIVDEYILNLDDIRLIENRIAGSMEIMVNCGVEKAKYRKKPSALCNYCIYKERGFCDGE